MFSKIEKSICENKDDNINTRQMRQYNKNIEKMKSAFSGNIILLRNMNKNSMLILYGNV